MSEVLRDLVVALSLDSDNFSRNLRTINKQIQEAESTFRLAGAGLDGFEKSVQGTEAKLSMLGNKLQEQNRAVEQYSRALVAANQKLSDSHTRQEKLNTALSDARGALAQAKTAVAGASDEYKKLSVSLGESDSATVLARENLARCEQEYQDAQDKVKLLDGQLKSNTKTLQNNADAIAKVKTDLNNAKASVKDTEAEVRHLTERLYTMQSGWTKAGEALTAFSVKTAAVSKTMITAGKGMTTAVTAPIVALGATAVKASVEYEDAFASVRKTVDATEAEYSQLSGSIKKMSTEVATSAEDIAEVMASAGQLGIQTNNLVGFTRTMIDLGNSTDIVANDAATAIAQFANVTGMAQTKFSNFGSALVALGNNFATTESAVMDMATRLGSAGSQIGLSEAQILGFATALSSVGLEAQAGGTAFSKAMIEMQVAVETGGDSLDDFARVSGLTRNAFKALWESDPAGAIQQFIIGLSKMDEEGVSSIVTLQEMGFTEVRLRDTLMRATNATELFSQTQETANAAWEENTALAEEANKRYATTKSRLTNLKNTALLFAQQIGDDLNPTIQSLIDRANELLASFLAMDESQRMAIIKFAAVAAAAGPALLVIGKTTSAVGKASAAIGKFATGMGKFSAKVKLAGGGVSGFVKTVGSSKLAVAALSAALIYGAYKLYDYASGAKAIREALEGMNQTASAWKNTAADTFYSKGGLSAFGMSEADFTRNTQTAQEWKDGLLAVWSDGKKETDEIVSDWTESFKTLTSSTREELQSMKDTADTSGYTAISSQISGDIAQLDAMDAEVENLLKKRQSKYFTEKDEKRLQQLVDEREAIEVKYHLTPADTDGFEAIRQKLQAEIARAQAQGQADADASVYESAMVAAAEGMAAVNTQLDAQYDKEYALIQLMQDSSEQQQALDALNAKYNTDRIAAAEQYAQTLAGIVMPVWDQEDIQQAGTDIDTLYTKLREYSIATANNDTLGMGKALEDMNSLTADMDEGSLTDYLGVLTQIQSLLDNGLSEDDINTLFPELDVSGQMEQISSLTQFIQDHKDTLSGLNTMFSDAVPDEVLQIATDLDMTGAQARWDAFAANPGAITADAVINSSIALVGYDLTAYNEFVQNNPVTVTGVVRIGEAFNNPSDVLNDPDATFWENGVEIPVSLVPAEKIDADTLIAYDDDGTLHVLITPEIQGTAESVQQAAQGLSKDYVTTSVFGNSSQNDWGFLNGILGGNLLDWMGSFNTELEAFQKNKGTWVTLWGLLNDTTLSGINGRMDDQFSGDNLANFTTYVSELTAVIQNGADLSEDDLSNLQTIVDFLNNLTLTDTGENIRAGVAQGMTEAGWDTDAETVATSLEAALNLALGIQSPSTRMNPVGDNVSAGVGVGMSNYDFTTDASGIAANLENAVTTALSGALNTSTLRPIGINAMTGLAAGIRAGQAGVVSAMRSAARAAVSAAKRELKIASPSGVFRDEIGRMTMKGFGQGVLLESKAQAKTIQNAARFLTDEAKSGSVAYTTSDNRRTYNQQSSVNLSGNTFYVRDEQDIRSLAVEIAALTKRQQRGKGLRMA